ncbi:FAD:protein FMN transferase [Parashewanella curva]|uniref:FAD:protein FMN transferase n=1 Tax=Parashewanella curva TaxID=2338552 RepID=A0A3L8PU96_9GAMM|nr:FAD:protein FMN transferase [Parashewanella curva]RLV58173.1 FAD:protein FMN transferase [Parashewanella curva]
MGTTYKVKYVAETDAYSQTIHDDIKSALELISDQMSTHRPKSEISRFNKLKKGQKLKVSKDFITVIKFAKFLQKETDGALDVSAGPLVNVWGFGPQSRYNRPPKQSVIDAAKAKVNLNAVMIKGRYLQKATNDVYIDLSPIARGFGVDKMASVLSHYGINNYQIEIDGEFRVKGTQANGEQWHIALKYPNKRIKYLDPRDMAVATSSEQRHFFEKNGKRYSHIIDPVSGYPIQHNLVSVTVMSKNTMMADGYATAMMVMGKEKAMQFAMKHKLAVMMVEKGKTGYKVTFSDAFKPYLKSVR